MKKRNDFGKWMIGVGGTGLVAVLLTIVVTQCNANKKLRFENAKQAAEAKQQRESIAADYQAAAAQLADLNAQVEEIKGCCRGKKLAPRPVAKPTPVAPRPVVKPAPALKSVEKPIVVYDTVVVRDTVRVDNSNAIIGPAEMIIVLDTNASVAPDTVFVHDTVRVPSNVPDTSVPVIKKSVMGPVSFTASFRNKLSSNAKCR